MSQNPVLIIKLRVVLSCVDSKHVDRRLFWLTIMSISSASLASSIPSLSAAPPSTQPLGFRMESPAYMLMLLRRSVVEVLVHETWKCTRFFFCILRRHILALHQITFFLLKCTGRDPAAGVEKSHGYAATLSVSGVTTWMLHATWCYCIASICPRALSEDHIDPDGQTRTAALGAWVIAEPTVSLP